MGLPAVRWAIPDPHGSFHSLEGRMADNDAPQGADAPEVPEPNQETPQVTDWKAEARKWEKRAKESLARADANEDAAKRLAEIEESQKTEAQKAQERLEAAEKRAADLELQAARAEVAAEKGVPLDVVSRLSGSTREEIESAVDALIKFRGEQKSLHVPNEGNSPALSGTTADAFAAFVEGKL